MKFLITGANGMLGGVLCSRLAPENEVLGFDVNIPAAAGLAAAIVKLDIRDRAEVCGYIRQARPDVVIHTAAYTAVDECQLNPQLAYDVNATGTKNISLACRDAGSLMVYISTDYVFDGEKGSEYTETDLANPINVYGKTKLEGEKFVKEICPGFLIVRSSGLFGKNGNNFVETVLQKARSGADIKVVTDQTSCPTYAEDLAEAVIKLIKILMPRKKDLQDIYHITNSGALSWYEFAKEILKVSNIKKEVLPITSQELARPAPRPKMSALSNSKYIKVAGRPMRHRREALEEYLK